LPVRQRTQNVATRVRIQPRTLPLAPLCRVGGAIPDRDRIMGTTIAKGARIMVHQAETVVRNRKVKAEVNRPISSLIPLGDPARKGTIKPSGQSRIPITWMRVTDGTMQRGMTAVGQVRIAAARASEASRITVRTEHLDPMPEIRV
jgi:hypothetical protein